MGLIGLNEEQKKINKSLVVILARPVFALVIKGFEEDFEKGGMMKLSLDLVFSNKEAHTLRLELEKIRNDQ